MSEQVTVKSFADGTDWTSDDGNVKLTFYDCVFDRGGSEFKATWNKQQGTGDPPIGEAIDGEFYEKKPGDWRFRKASKPQGGTSSSGGGNHGAKSGGGGWKPESQFDPEKVARITRAHSQEMAVRLLAPRDDFNEAPKPQRQQAVKAWADWFDADIQQAAVGAALKDGLNATETPAVRPAAADGEIVDDDGVIF
jgi:hypothetical protein